MKVKKVYDMSRLRSRSYDVGRRIEFVCEPWKKLLKLDEFIINDALHHIYLKVYSQIDSETIDNFDSFFAMLKILNLKWRLDDRSMVINFLNVDEDEIETYLDANKYNL